MMKCPTCESCEYEQYCGATEIMRKCERHNKKVEQTNEEWFDTLSTEEKAKFMCNIYEMGKNGKEYFMRLDKAIEWLKQPHTEKE